MSIYIKAQAVAKDRRGTWLMGTLKKNHFHNLKEIKGIEDVPHVKNYVTLRQYLKLQHRAISEAENILNRLEVEKLFLLPKHVVSSTSEKEKTLCSSCKKKCKSDQGIYSCSLFEQR